MQSKWHWLGAFLWVAALVFGLVGVGGRLRLGHELTGGTSYIPWGLWVAGYIYLIGLSAGAFLLSSMAYVFNIGRLEKIGKLALFTAITTLLTALLLIWMDLGHMARFWEVFARPNFHSMMAWMVWLYTAYFVLLLAEIYFAVRPDLSTWAGRGGAAGAVARWLLGGRNGAQSEEQLLRDRRVLRVLGTIGVPLAVAFHGGVGALFATPIAREYWHTALLPLVFLVGALLSGGALLTALAAFFWPEQDAEWRETVAYLGRVVLVLLALDELLEWAEYSVPMWYGIGSEAQLMSRVLYGPYWYVFWIVHLLLGVTIPALILWRKGRSPAWAGVASGLVAVTFLAVRLDIVIPGLVTPEIAGLERAYLSHRLSYTYFPTLNEWQVLVFTLAFGVALLWAGMRWLPLLPTGIGSRGAKR